MAVVDRQTALVLVQHLLRAELRRPELADLLAHYFDKYHFSEHDRRTLAAAVRSQAWIQNYLAERGVADAEREQAQTELLRGAVVTLEELRLREFQAKQFTAMLQQRGDNEAAPDAPKRRKGD